MDTDADHGHLRLLHAPQRGQDGSAQGHNQRELHRRGSVTKSCCTTLEAAGVSGTQDGTGQRLPTEVRVQAAADVQGERPCGVKFWEV